MIKDIKLKPFTTPCKLPVYVMRYGVTEYTLTAKTNSGYVITLAKLFIGIARLHKAVSTHAVFKSYTNHGEKMAETKARVAGAGFELTATQLAMIRAGIEFDLETPCHFLDLMTAIGARYSAENPDIEEYGLMSQTCH